MSSLSYRLLLAAILFVPCAAAAGELHNVETFVPPQCYTRTGNAANPCYVCHTPAAPPNYLDDAELQSTYSFAPPALRNHWTNLFVDRRPAMARIARAEIERWVRADNYSPWLRAYRPRAPEAYAPDLDLARGFDDEGFARDGSGWRALRYVPFPGTFWPTNGAASDTFIRLPAAFRTDIRGKPSRAIYKANLAVLEAALKLQPPRPGAGESRDVRAATEPLDERAVGADLDGDGASGTARELAVLPSRYLGGARGVPVVPRLYPEGTEFLHTVRYLDPQADGMLARRVKEVRYSRKYRFLSPSRLSGLAEAEHEDKEKGLARQVAGAPGTGFTNGQGWVLQGWIEDATGALRLQSEEEQRYCLGCHGSIGATFDSTFAFPRKLPAGEGWRVQSLTGMPDYPMRGAKDGHVLTYFARAGGGDEFRANDEMRRRFFRNGALDRTLVRQAAPGGDRDLAWLLLPSAERAWNLNRAYLLLVREQSFVRGRDPVLTPVTNVHREIANGETENGAAENVFQDGTLLLDFGTP